VIDQEKIGHWGLPEFEPFMDSLAGVFWFETRVDRNGKLVSPSIPTLLPTSPVNPDCHGAPIDRSRGRFRRFNNFKRRTLDALDGLLAADWN
jgi:hypothetical protein